MYGPQRVTRCLALLAEESFCFGAAAHVGIIYSVRIDNSISQGFLFKARDRVRGFLKSIVALCMGHH